MYPSIPIGSLANQELPATGFAVAGLLLVASVLVLVGLLMVRSSKVLRQGIEA